MNAFKAAGTWVAQIDHGADPIILERTFCPAPIDTFQPIDPIKQDSKDDNR